MFIAFHNSQCLSLSPVPPGSSAFNRLRVTVKASGDTSGDENESNRLMQALLEVFTVGGFTVSPLYLGVKSFHEVTRTPDSNLIAQLSEKALLLRREDLPYPQVLLETTSYTWCLHEILSGNTLSFSFSATENHLVQRANPNFIRAEPEGPDNLALTEDWAYPTVEVPCNEVKVWLSMLNLTWEDGLLIPSTHRFNAEIESLLSLARHARMSALSKYALKLTPGIFWEFLSLIASCRSSGVDVVLNSAVQGGPQ